MPYRPWSDPPNEIDCPRIPIHKGYCMSWDCTIPVLTVGGVSLTALIAAVSSDRPQAGFGWEGISADSVAASWQSKIGNVTARSALAILTSIGMAGMNNATYVWITGASAAVAEKLCDYFKKDNMAGKGSTWHMDVEYNPWLLLIVILI